MKYILKKVVGLILKKFFGSAHKGYGYKYNKPGRKAKGLKRAVKKILD